jgi:two-component system sensor kinase FixL
MLTSASPRWREALLIGAYLVGYVALDWVSYVYPVAPPLAITPWNPPPGLSLALLLRRGLRLAPWLFVASLLAEMLVRGAHLEMPVVLVASLLPAVAYTVLAAALRRRLRSDFVTLRDAAVFLTAVAVATAVTAAAVVTLFRAADYLPPSAYLRSIAQFWIGDLIGIVVTTPLLLVLSRGRSADSAVVRWPEAAAQLGTLVVALWVVFGSGWLEELKLFYVLFLPLIWIAMRWGIGGTVIATALIQVGLIAALRVGGYGSGTVLQFQFLLLALAATALVLGATVSERREIERELRAKQAELDRSLRLAGASEMASALAHELNQPLTAIATYARACQAMARAPASPPGALRDTMDKVVAEASRASDVVRQLRDFFRTGSGHLVATPVPGLLQAALDAARPRGERAQIQWILRCDDRLPTVLVDRIQVETVLHNLLSNAIDALKVVPAGQRRVALSASMDGAQWVRVTVADNGPGLPPDIASQLFRPFATSKPEGMGLGLAISRSIVEAHGGRLWLESAKAGCTFAFTLPVTPTA